MAPLAIPTLERPIYGLSEAATYLGLRRDKVRSWLDGYTRGDRTYPPVIRPESTSDEIVTWGEFVELGYLREYRRKGVSLQYLRPVIAELRSQLGVRYPLATESLYLHGKELVWKLQEEKGLPPALAMVVMSGQVMFLADEANSFFNKVRFDPSDSSDEAHRIYPAGIDAHVSIDPRICFGRPAIRGVATERIWELRVAGEKIRDIAVDYELDEHLVRAAVSYEELQRVLAA